MNRSFPVSIPLVLAFLLGAWAAESGHQASDSSAALQADHAFRRALANADKTALNQLLDPEFTWIDSSGKSLTTAQVLESLPTPANADVEPQVRAHGNTAVLCASRDRLHVLRIWVQRKADWRLVLYQEVQQVEKSEPPAPARAGSTDCENPCKSIPFVPETQSEKEAIASWQGVMRAMADNDAGAYSQLIADDFTQPIRTTTAHTPKLTASRKSKSKSFPARDPLPRN